MTIRIILSALMFALLALSFIGILYNMYMLRRDDKVCEFRGNILDGLPSRDFDRALAIYRKYTYDDMLYSFKPLRLEAWFTEYEIRILKGDGTE